LGPVAAVVLATSAALAPGAGVKAKPSLRAVVFRGLGSDVVGRLGSAKPNGERDGRFSAVLDTRGGRWILQGVVLQRMLSKESYAEVWDANPGSSPSVLGVFLNGRRLNPTDRSLNVPVKGRYRLEVYANDHAGAFAPGQVFRITVQFKDYVTAAARTTLPGRPPTITASFAGLGQDVVGRGVDQKPNGEPDAHFVVRLDTHGAWQILTNVVVRRLTAEGAPDVPLYWMQGPLTAGLFVNGKRHTWPTELPEWISVYVPLDPAAGQVRLDIYANDPTPKGQPSQLFGSGQQYRVSVEFTDTQLLPGTSAVVRIG
jgi:hypothetical protein